VKLSAAGMGIGSWTHGKARFAHCTTAVMVRVTARVTPQGTDPYWKHLRYTHAS